MPWGLRWTPPWSGGLLGRVNAPAPGPGDPLGELLHQVNNLLSVIRTQGEVAALVPGEASARDALRHIAAAGERTEEVVQRFRSGG